MASLDQQLETLIQEAPGDEVTATLVALIGPLLKQFASQLQRLEYYVLQTLDGGWLITTLSHRRQPEREKAVVYAFPTLEDAHQQAKLHKDTEVVAVALPVISVIFQLIALREVDSILVFERPGQQQAVEIQRQVLQQQIQQQMQPLPPQPARRIPPDLA
jgi:hypothetical protein